MEPGGRETCPEGPGGSAPRGGSFAAKDPSTPPGFRCVLPGARSGNREGGAPGRPRGPRAGLSPLQPARPCPLPGHAPRGRVPRSAPAGVREGAEAPRSRLPRAIGTDAEPSGRTRRRAGSQAPRPAPAAQPGCRPRPRERPAPSRRAPLRRSPSARPRARPGQSPPPSPLPLSGPPARANEAPRRRGRCSRRPMAGQAVLRWAGPRGAAEPMAGRAALRWAGRGARLSQWLARAARAGQGLGPCSPGAPGPGLIRSPGRPENLDSGELVARSLECPEGDAMHSLGAQP